MTACQFYFVLSAVLVLISGNFFPVFKEEYSVWLVPLLFVGLFVALLVLQLLCLVLMIFSHKAQKKPSEFKESLFRFLLKHSLPIIVFLTGTKINIEGTENLPEDKRFFLVCNHQHDFDPAVILSAFPDSKISFIGKKEILTEMKFIAKAMSLLSCLFIDREHDREAAKTIVSAIKYIKSDERSIALFPEGYTSKTDELLPFRNGSLKVAVKSGAPVAVCVLNNTKSITKNMFRRKTVVEFKLLDVIYPESYEGMSTAELGDLIHNKMNTALQELKTKS